MILIQYLRKHVQIIIALVNIFASIVLQKTFMETRLVTLWVAVRCATCVNKSRSKLRGYDVVKSHTHIADGRKTRLKLCVCVRVRPCVTADSFHYRLLQPRVQMAEVNS